jgi:hypothetical protein
MSPEEKARISRENGAKSKGPTSAEGKAKSARNGIKTGEYTQNLSLFVPPDSALLCNEDRQAFYELMDALIASNQPATPEALQLVRQMAIARWQIERLNTCITMHWNLAILEAGNQPATLVPELGDVETMVRASEMVNTGSAIVDKLNRQIDRLEMRVTRLRRAIRDCNAHAPQPVQEIENRTQPNPAPVVENKELNNQNTEPPIYITERDAVVIAGYRREFPNRRIILLPADDVANGIEIDDDMPTAPRKVA